MVLERGHSEKQSIIRPKVDPDALGEVDPNLYPEAKDATHKIRGRHDIVEYLLGDVDHELLIVKVFYFFFYSAFGSLFPLMGVYFKQMGMTPGQCGLLVGCRPFVEFLSAPFWGSYADRWKKGKTLLMVSLSCWIIFTLPIAYLQPPPSRCLRQNESYYVLELPHKNSYVHTTVFNKDEQDETTANVTKIPGVGKSPFTVYSKSLSDIVSPLFSSIVYEVQDIQKSFFLMLLLVLIGEFFSAPAITLVDSAVITLLGDDADRYGHQRMFGSLGWGLAMFFLGIALDHSTEFADHPCGKPGKYEKNYKICFYAFSVLMGCALVTAMQINFRYDDDSKDDDKLPKKNFVNDDYDDVLEQEVAQQLNLPSLASNSSSGLRRRPSTPSKQNRIPDVGKTQMFAQTTREIPEWITVLKHFANVKCSAFLFVAWFMGFGIGLIFTFLFWHLQEYGGTPTLFGFASVINHISEIFAYFFSFQLIQQMGHVKVLCLGLAGNVIRFLYVSWLTDPWLVLPFELMQGITHAAVWAACCSYIAHNTPQELRSSAQGVLQGIHHGLGRGCGAVIGGMFVTYYGSKSTFRIYGLLCAVVLAVFVFINFYRKDTGFVSDLPVSEDPHQVAEESVHLAPHGVPSNPIPRVLSTSKLHDLTSNGNHSYGTTSCNGSKNLNIPGRTSKNPFVQDIDTATSGGTNSEMLTQTENKYDHGGNMTIHVQQPQSAHKQYDW